MQTIKSNKEIDYIFKNGKRINLPFFNIIKIQNNPNIKGKVAFITGKKLGNAVWRNKAKRRLKNLYNEFFNPLNLEDYQVLFLAKKEILNKKYSCIVSETKKEYEKNCKN